MAPVGCPVQYISVSDETFAAVVVRCNEDETVNLKVFKDGHDADEWVQNVPFSDFGDRGTYTYCGPVLKEAGLPADEKADTKEVDPLTDVPPTGV